MSDFERRQAQTQNSHLVHPAQSDRAMHQPAHVGNPLLAQQRALGNQAVQRLAESCPVFPSRGPFGGACHTCPARVQTKLTINRPGDKYEQEADRVAERVMRMPEPYIQKEAAVPERGQDIRIQRACPECDEEEALQAKPLAAQITPLVQRQVEPEEEEEEPIQAKSLATETTPLVQRQIEPEEEEEEPIQTKLAESVQVQRQEEEPEEEEEEPVQAKQAGGQTPRVGPGLSAQIRSLRGGGQPLPHSVRGFFEPRFGYDFSHVRVHTGLRATETARAVSARAFTTEQDIVFGARQYAPGTGAGQQLLAHELTHIVQQERDSPLNNHGLETSPLVRVGESVRTERVSTTQKIQRAECERQSWYRCRGRRLRTVLKAFKLAAQWLAVAKGNIRKYVKNPTDRSNRKAARALKRHFSWTEAVRRRLIYAEVPGEVEKAINLLYKKISVPFRAFCRKAPRSRKKDGEKLAAASPVPWAKTNCYEFYPHFFKGWRRNARFQATAILHEMTHSWMNTTDVAYEWERKKYPLRPGAAINNADSYAALIRDIGK